MDPLNRAAKGGYTCSETVWRPGLGHNVYMDEALLTLVGLQSERVVLRKASGRDLEAWVTLKSDPHVRRYLGGPVTEDRVRSQLLRQGVTSTTADVGTFVVADSTTDEMLGMVSLERRSSQRPGHVLPGADELELSYLLVPSQWGKGIAFEACSLLLGAAASHTAEKVALVVTQMDNAPAIRLAKRLGFTQAGTFLELGALQWLGQKTLHVSRP